MVSLILMFVRRPCPMYCPKTSIFSAFGAFFLAYKDLWGGFDESSPPALCFFQSLSQGQSTVAQRAEMTVAERSLTGCV